MSNVYRLKEACAFYPYDGHAGETAFILRLPDNRQFKISPTARDILLQLDGRTTLDELAATLNSRSIEVSAEELRSLIRTQYHTLGIVDDLDTSPKPAPEVLKAHKVQLPFFLHWDVIPEKSVQAVSSRLKFMFSRPAVFATLCVILGAHYVAYSRYSATEFLSHAAFLPVLTLSLLSIVWHEFGHASAVSKYGGSPGKIGFGLFVLIPSFYADVSEIWRFSRKHRMIVDLGGVYFQQIFFAVIAVIGVITSQPDFFVVCRFIDVMVLVTLNPVVRFDGYWLLADWLALPNLNRLAFSYMGDVLKRILGRKRNVPRLPPMPRHRYVVFTVYSAVSSLFLVCLLWMSYHYIYSTFMNAYRSLPATFNSMTFALKAHDMSLSITQLVTLFFVVAFPVSALVGAYKYGVILVRYFTRKAQTIHLGPRHPGPEASTLSNKESR